MGFYAQSPSPPGFYSQGLQLKLYQAFIFSIPILFSIILFLLFYLFYLKKRVLSALSSPSENLPHNSNQAAFVDSSGTEVVDIIKEKLPVVIFDEHLKAGETLCCVCLGEFEVKEELHQLPLCKHVFHTGCIRHWLHSNTTCPLCRCSLAFSTKKSNPDEPDASPNSLPNPEQQEQLGILVTRVEDFTVPHPIVGHDGSSGSGHSVLHAESVVIRIQDSET